VSGTGRNASKGEEVMSLKQVRHAALAVAALALMSQPLAALAKTKVILSNDTQALSLKGKSFELLKTEIEKRLGDKAAVELHQSGALFDQKTQIQGLQLGGAHMIAPTVGIYSSITPKVNALLLPFLLPNEKAVDEAVKDEVVRASFVPDLEKKNVLPVAIWVNGPRNIGYKRKEPILTPDGMKGLKIRVQSAPIYVECAAFERARRLVARGAYRGHHRLGDRQWCTRCAEYGCQRAVGQARTGGAAAILRPRRLGLNHAGCDFAQRLDVS
jgi:hypothetical protein